MEELNKVRVSVAINSVAAIAMGWLSVYIASAGRALFAGIAGIVIMVIVGFITQAAFKGKGRKWWLSNGVAVFILVWAVSWIFFLNI